MHRRAPFDTLLFASLMLALATVAVLGFIAPILAYRLWRGGWRIAAALPGIMMAFVVLRIAVGVAVDLTSHNLWPFETLMAGAVAMVAAAALAVLRKLAGATNHAGCAHAESTVPRHLRREPFGLARTLPRVEAS